MYWDTGCTIRKCRGTRQFNIKRKTLQNDWKKNCSCSFISYPNNNKQDKINIIKTEIKQLFEQSCKGKFMTVLYESLLSIAPTSVESERAFSAAGLFCTKIRSALSDLTLNVLCFLRYYFINKEKSMQK